MESTPSRSFENRLALLEKRVVLLERFVETRFCKSVDAVQDLEDLEINAKKPAKAKAASKRKTTASTVIESPKQFRITLVSTKTRYGRSTRLPAKLSEAVSTFHSKSHPPSDQLGEFHACDDDDTNEASSVPDNIKTAPLSETEEISHDYNEYFTFSRDKADNPDQELDSDYEPTDFFSNDSTKTKISNKSIPLTSKLTDTTKPLHTPRGRYKRRKLPSSGPAVPQSSSEITLQNLTKEECPVCKKFFKKEVLPSHMECHTKERHLKCQYCDKTFFNTNMVRKHEKIHNREKFAKPCRLCQKMFIETGKLLVHERSCIRRALEKKQAVDTYIMEDVRNRSIGVDLKWPGLSVNDTVVGDNERTCGYCSKVVSFDDYSLHLKTDHASWKCGICEETYINKAGLRRHMSNYHGQGPPSSETSQTNADTCTEIENGADTKVISNSNAEA